MLFIKNSHAWLSRNKTDKILHSAAQVDLHEVSLINLFFFFAHSIDVIYV